MSHDRNNGHMILILILYRYINKLCIWHISCNDINVDWRAFIGANIAFFWGLMVYKYLCQLPCRSHGVTQNRIGAINVLNQNCMKTY